MKIYTQREVEKAIIEFIKNEYTLSHPNLDKVIATLTPIELPTDEELEEISKHEILYNNSKKSWWLEGAKWMRYKIGGQE